MGPNWRGTLGRRRENYCWGLPERRRPTSLGKGSGSPRKNVWGTIERRQRHKFGFQDGDKRWRLGWEDGIREGSRIVWVGVGNESGTEIIHRAEGNGRSNIPLTRPSPASGHAPMVMCGMTLILRDHES